jgi:hypothetical protein
MEKYKTHQLKSEYSTINLFGWRFAEDERKALKAALKNFNKTKVEKFINGLEFL